MLLKGEVASKVNFNTFLIHKRKQSSQQSKVTQGEGDDDNKKDVSYDQSHESSQQARVAQSLQAHDYVSFIQFTARRLQKLIPDLFLT